MPFAGFRLPLSTAVPAYIQTVSLDGTRYRMRVVYRRRTRSWYLSLYTADETPIILGRRLSPGSGPLHWTRRELAPPGFLYVRGVDPYDRDDAGTSLELVYYNSADIRPVVAPSTATGLTVVV